MTLTMQQKQAAYRAKNQAKFAAQRAARKANPNTSAAQSLAVKNANAARAAGTAPKRVVMPSEMTAAQRATKPDSWWGGTKPTTSTATTTPTPTTPPPTTTPNQNLKFGGDVTNVMNEMFPSYGGQKIATPGLTSGGVTDLYGGGQAFYTGQESTYGQTSPYGAENSLSVDLTPPKPVDSGYAGQGETTTQPYTAPNPYAVPGQESEATARYQRELEQQQLAERQAQEAYDTLKNKYKAENDAAMKAWDADAERRYQAQLDQAQQDTDRTAEEMMRFKGAKGTTRSSRTMDAMQVIQDKGNQVKQSLLAQRDRERELYKAQLAGATAEELAPYVQALKAAQETRMGTEAVLLKAKQGLLLEQQQAAEEVKLQEQQQYVDYLKQVGMAVDPRTGETTESLQGMLDRAKAAKDTASGQKYLIEAQKMQKALDNNLEVKFTKDSGGNAVAVWYDPSKPGEMQTVDLGGAPVASTGGGSYSSGGGYSSGSSSGSAGSSSGDFNENYIDNMALRLATSGYGDANNPGGPSTWDDINSKVNDLPVSLATKKAILDRTAQWKAYEV